MTLNLSIYTYCKSEMHPQISLVYINTLLIQQVLADPEWMQKMGPDELRALTPLIYAHVNPYGVFRSGLGRATAD